MSVRGREHEAAHYLLEDDLTPRKAASLTYIAAELGEDSEIYGEVQDRLISYLSSTDEMMKGASTGENIEVTELRELVKEREKRFYEACESAFGETTDTDRELIEESQKGYLHAIRDDLTYEGEEVEVFQN